MSDTVRHLMRWRHPLLSTASFRARVAGSTRRSPSDSHTSLRSCNRAISHRPNGLCGLQLGEGEAELLHATAFEDDGDLLVAALDFAGDDDAVAERGVTHLLAALQAARGGSRLARLLSQ